MNYKYKLVQRKGDIEIAKEYKTLKEISDALDVEIHIVRKINQLTEMRITNLRPHHIHKDIYDNIKIYNIKKALKSIE